MAANAKPTDTVGSIFYAANRPLLKQANALIAQKIASFMDYGVTKVVLGNMAAEQQHKKEEEGAKKTGAEPQEKQSAAAHTTRGWPMRKCWSHNSQHCWACVSHSPPQQVRRVFFAVMAPLTPRHSPIVVPPATGQLGMRPGGAVWPPARYVYGAQRFGQRMQVSARLLKIVVLFACTAS